MAPIADQFSSYQFSVKNTTGLLNTLIYIQFCMKNNLFSKKANLHNMCRRQISPVLQLLATKREYWL